jgi:uncharacterized protein YegL
MSNRPLHFIWLVDCSGSMDVDGKIQSLNNAVREAIPVMREAAADNPHAQVLMRVLAFSDGARWILAQPMPIEQFTWSDLFAGGVTDLGAALGMVADVMHVPPMDQRALPPVLVLVSDGQPTDDFARGLDRLLGVPWGKKAVRIAIGIGSDADYDVLQRFIANPEIKPVQAHNPEQLKKHIRWASTLVKDVSQPKAVSGAGPVIPQPPPESMVAGDPDVTW